MSSLDQSLFNLAGSGWSTTLPVASFFSFNSTPAYDNSGVTIPPSTVNVTAQMLSPIDYQYWALILVIFQLATVFGNVLVGLSIIREPSLQSTTNYFLFSLAGADIGLALFVMPLNNWVEVNNGYWRHGALFCDIFVMFDVMLCTASILHLVAISIDRYVAVTNPVVYSRHNNKLRVFVTIALVWIVSILIALPIVCGFNNTPDRLDTMCVLNMPEYIIASSIGSFYLPCLLMIVLYYRVFKVIHARSKRIVSNGSKVGEPKVPMASTKVTSLCIGRRPRCCNHKQPTGYKNERRGDDEHTHFIVNPITRAQSEGDKEEVGRDRMTSSDEDFAIHDERVRNVASDTVNATTTSTTTPSFKDMDDFRRHLRHRIRKAKRCSLTLKQSSLGLTGQQMLGLKTVDTSSSPSQSKRVSKSKRRRWRQVMIDVLPRSASVRRTDGIRPDTSANAHSYLASTRSLDPMATRNCPGHRKENKAIKTLVIVLGAFLFCWMPFFTVNIIHAFCYKYDTKKENGFCNFPRKIDSLCVWLGYMNSFVNPIIYTIFNTEFRKAFKKILHCG